MRSTEARRYAGKDGGERSAPAEEDCRRGGQERDGTEGTAEGSQRRGLMRIQYTVYNNVL